MMAMQTAPLRSILEATFRANPAYQLVLFDRLSPEERRTLADLQKDPEFYGLLRPQDPRLGTKSVGRDTALLFFTMQTPGPIPAYLLEQLGPSSNETIARLVLDRILEMDVAGAFLSGAEAHSVIYGEPPAAGAGGVLEQLSIQALRYAQGLEVADSFQLSSRLYLYNRLPASPSWKRVFPSENAVAQHLEIQPGGRNHAVLERHWISRRPAPDNPGWRIWTSPARGEHPVKARSYKLYICPRSEHLRDGFRATLEVLTEVRAPQFKIGKDVYGVLRPDKLVAYFGCLEEVRETAERLRQRLQGMPAQGVPFTAPLDDAGLLSWGMDPPRGEHLLPWQGPSWRRWVTDRLAVALLSAKATPRGSLEPWQFALDRLRLEGIDTTSWSPDQGMWDTVAKG
jgi:hypothetical protein